MKILNYFKKNYKKNEYNGVFSNEILDCYWDFEINPISFDIVWMLSAATLFAKNNGFNSIRLNFIPEKNSLQREYPKNYLDVISRENLEWRRRNICYSVPYLFPLVKSIRHWENRDGIEFTWKQSLITNGEIGYHWLYYKYINQNYNNFNHTLEVSKSANIYIKNWAKDFGVSIEDSLVITLREYGVDSIRNNNLDELEKFIKVVKKDFSSIIIIRDTDKGKISDFFKQLLVCDIASVNVELRAAIYESAKLNIAVSSGPASLLQLNSKSKFIISNYIHESVAPAKEEFFLMKGFEINKKPYFLSNNQKWVWKKDNFENLIDAYKDIIWE
jgi:hypothetical protein